MSRFNSPFSRSLLLPLTALLVLGCGSRGPVSAGGGEAEARSGIQTRSIRSAPAAERARNESKPLSELNTPDAIAAREAAARSAGPAARSTTARAPVATSAPLAPDVSGVAEAEALLAAPDPHQKVEAFQTGARVTVRSGAKLYARPSASSEVAPLTGSSEVELGTQIYNASGYWYYVGAGKESGWLLQSDILR